MPLIREKPEATLSLNGQPISLYGSAASAASSELRQGRGFADAFETVYKLGYEIRYRQMQAQARADASAETLERGPDGALKKPSSREAGITVYGATYNALMTDRYEKQSILDATNGLLRLRTQNDNDPVKFLAAAKAYAEATVSAADPSVRGVLQDHLNTLIVQHHADVDRRRAVKDMNDAEKVAEHDIGRRTGDLRNLITAQGRDDHPSVAEAESKLLRTIEDGVKKGYWTEERAAVYRENIRFAKAQGVVVADYQLIRDPVEQERFVQRIIRGQDPRIADMPEEQRRVLATEIVRMNTADSQAAAAEARQLKLVQDKAKEDWERDVDDHFAKTGTRMSPAVREAFVQRWQQRTGEPRYKALQKMQEMEGHFFKKKDAEEKRQDAIIDATEGKRMLPPTKENADAAAPLVQRETGIANVGDLRMSEKHKSNPTLFASETAKYLRGGVVPQQNIELLKYFYANIPKVMAEEPHIARMAIAVYRSMADQNSGVSDRVQEILQDRSVVSFYRRLADADPLTLSSDQVEQAHKMATVAPSHEQIHSELGRAQGDKPETVIRNHFEKAVADVRNAPQNWWKRITPGFMTGEVPFPLHGNGRLFLQWRSKFMDELAGVDISRSEPVENAAKVAMRHVLRTWGPSRVGMEATNERNSGLIGGLVPGREQWAEKPPELTLPIPGKPENGQAFHDAMLVKAVRAATDNGTNQHVRLTRDQVKAIQSGDADAIARDFRLAWVQDGEWRGDGQVRPTYRVMARAGEGWQSMTSIYTPDQYMADYVQAREAAEKQLDGERKKDVERLRKGHDLYRENPTYLPGAPPSGPYKPSKVGVPRPKYGADEVPPPGKR